MRKKKEIREYVILMKFNLLFKGNWIKREKKHTYPGGNVEIHTGEEVNKLLHQIQWIVRIDENYGYTD